MKASTAAGTPFEAPSTSPGRLTETRDFGPNPGNLRMFSYAPQELSASPALVVVLHGCTQTAAGYDLGTGWSILADRYRFVVLLPEQQEANNPKRCFNWFQPGDTERGQGEARSIRQMVDHALQKHGVDPQRVFVTGLSAGGAMTSTMLATYPEVFAGGAIIAGLPYRCATSVTEAFECMFQGPTRPAREWGDLVRNASPHRGPWPRLSVWHGSEDRTVLPSNAGEIIKQWTDVHGLPASANRSEIVDGYPRRVWTNAAGEDVIEEYEVTGMAHGTPLATGDGDNDYGSAGPFLLNVGISSSYHIAKFWGLTEAPLRARDRTAAPKSAPAEEKAAPEPTYAAQEEPERTFAAYTSSGYRRPSSRHDVRAVITKALKAAGLMK